ncbi:SecDF P1 head subdomain-containing protein [Streptomyces cucumeris]|uniref:SecDF P1 head subdomain-containing protein n=1 Tax=Streptomyces cucumeris TaxID=2962890 RepID=UPI003D7103CA
MGAGRVRGAAAVGLVLVMTALTGCGGDGGGGGGEGGRDPRGGPAPSVSVTASAPADTGAPRTATPLAEPLRLLPVVMSAPGTCPSVPFTADPDGYATYQDREEICYVVRPDDGMTVDEPRSAEAGYDENGGGHIVTVTFNSRDAARFARLTQELSTQQAPGNELAIVRDGRVLSAPSVASSITGGTVVISGGFTAASARELARGLGGG